MTISAQVIDTIVEWIDDNLHQPLRIDDTLAMPGIRNGICNGCFYSTKGEPGALYSRKEAAAGRAICATPISGSTISASSMALIRNRPLPASLPDLQSAAGRLPQREPQSRPLRRASPGLTLEENQRRHTQRSTRYSMAPSAKNQTKQHRIELVEIHHMECLNQLLRQRQASEGGQQQTGEQGQQ